MKKGIFGLLGLRPTSGPPAQAGPTRVRACLLPLARARGDRGRSRPPRGRTPRATRPPVAPARSDSRRRARAPASSLASFPSRSLSPAAAAESWRTLVPPLAVVTPLPPYAPTSASLVDSSRPQPRLASLHLVLAPFLPLKQRWGRIWAFPSTAAPWPPSQSERGRSSSVSFLPPFSPFYVSLHLADLARALLAATVACTGRPPCASAAMCAGELNAELVWPRSGHHQLCLVARSVLVVVLSPTTSPTARSRWSNLSPLSLWQPCGASWPMGPGCLSLYVIQGWSHGGALSIFNDEFLKRSLRNAFQKLLESFRNS
jgi:hypothetical protein